MLQQLARVLEILAALLVTGTAALGAPPTDVKLPPGPRTHAAGELVSGSRGSDLRDATDFFARDLARRGVTVTQIGPYRVRGVELTRFVSQTPTTSWLAFHVVRTGGKTLISFVLRPKA